MAMTAQQAAVLPDHPDTITSARVELVHIRLLWPTRPTQELIVIEVSLAFRIPDA